MFSNIQLLSYLLITCFYKYYTVGDVIFQHTGYCTGYMLAADYAQGMATPDAEQNSLHPGPVGFHFFTLNERLERMCHPVPLLYCKRAVGGRVFLLPL